jgi:hypothetical protein
MSEEDLDTMCDLLKKYYGNGEEEKEAPPVPAPETPKPTDNSLLLLFQRFDTPEKLAENPLLAEQKMNCLLQIDAMLESFTDAERKDGDFIRKYLKNRIWFVSPISGEAFIPEQIHIKGEASWAVYYESLSNILSLGGVPYFYIGDDAIEGLKVSVDGEANYDGKKELYQKYKDEYAEVQDEEDWRSGALLKYTQWYGLAYAVEIAKNFITNHYVASFKFPKFTEEFEKLFTKIEVQYEQKNYKGETSLTNAEVYYRNGDGKWLYILQSEDGYAAMYTNDFMQGYNLVKNMVTETDGYLSYVKDVSGFEESLMSATRPYEQLLQKYPQIFGAGKELNIPQMILDLKLLLSLEDDPIEYAWLKQKLEDLELLQSFP